MSSTLRPPIRLLLVDDSELVRRGIKTVLAAEIAPAMTVVAEAGSISEAVAAAARTHPDVVLLDIRLADGSGLEACGQILECAPAARIIILSSYSNDNFVYDAVTAGAQGYLMKEIDPAILVQAVQDVAAGRSILDPQATDRVIRLLRGHGTGATGPADLSQLSAQEKRVLGLVAEGLTNKEVGERLELSENTVKNYLVNVFEKLQVKRRAQAAAIYVQALGPRRA
jgi:two-component system, NarL family, response regulator DevR